MERRRDNDREIGREKDEGMVREKIWIERGSEKREIER